MPKRSAVSEYLATIGSKGGKATGQRKARSPEHYAKMVKARKSKRARDSAPPATNAGANRVRVQEGGE